MNKIYIDTTDNTKVILKLTIEKKKFVKERKVETRSAQHVLPLIDKLLKEHTLTVKNVDEILINIGPGSFTGIRVGISIANALAFGLGIPVNGKKVEKGKTFIEPRY